MAIRIQGRQVRALRGALGLEAAQFAGVLGVHPSTVHRWEAAEMGFVPVDGVAANVLVALASKLDGDRKAKAQAEAVGEKVAQALVLGGALVALVALVEWLTKNAKPG